MVRKNNCEFYAQVREIQCCNLTRVLGACIDIQPPVLIAEFCPKGSLRVGNSYSQTWLYGHLHLGARCDNSDSGAMQNIFDQSNLSLAAT
jgi:hypothetical protein